MAKKKSQSGAGVTGMIERRISRGYVIRIGKVPGHGFHASAVTTLTCQENRFVEGPEVGKVIEGLYGKIFKGGE
jgi:hypothetical protein